MKSHRILAFAMMMVAGLAGCAIVDGSSLVTGTPRASISPAMVKIYRVAPEKYEEIALVYASAGHDFQSDSTLLATAVEKLKNEAAKLGANGIILGGVNQRDTPQTVTGFGTTTAYGAGGSVSGFGTVVGVNRGDAYTRVEGIAVFVQ